MYFVCRKMPVPKVEPTTLRIVENISRFFNYKKLDLIISLSCAVYDSENYLQIVKFFISYVTMYIINFIYFN